jgi:1-deoxy-D-xylulose-5-phosphate reductoisomerase
MKLPIQYALLYPDSLPGPVPPYPWDMPKTWSFEAPDLDRFPCLGLAYDALRAGGTAPALLNAANEEAVAAFLSRAIPFWDIQAVNREVLEKLPVASADSLEQVLEADRNARELARDWILRRGSA